MDKKKIFDKFIVLFILLSPILDLFSCIQSKYLNLPVSISFVIRGLFFVLIFIYLIRKQDNRKILILFLIYFILAVGSYFVRKINLHTEIVNLVRMFYLPIMMIFASKYENDKIDDKFILKIYMFYIVSFIIMHLLNMDIYYITVVSAVLVGILPIALNYIFDSKSYILKIAFYVLFLASIFIISTKLIVIGSFVVFMFMYVNHYKYEFLYNDFKKRFILIMYALLFIVIYCAVIRFSPFYISIKEELISLNIHTFRDVYSFKTIDTLLFSGTLTNIRTIIRAYFDGGYDAIMYGIGKTGIGKYTGMDPFDIIATTGIFGSAIFIIIFIYIQFKTELKNIYYYSYFTFLVISLFQGKSLIFPSISLLVSVLYIVSRNSVDSKKKRSS